MTRQARHGPFHSCYKLVGRRQALLADVGCDLHEIALMWEGLMFLARLLAIHTRLSLGEAPPHFLADALPVLGRHLRHGTRVETLKEYRLQPLPFTALPIFADQLADMLARFGVVHSVSSQLDVALDRPEAASVAEVASG
jgi:hypothetical protein